MFCITMFASLACYISELSGLIVWYQHVSIKEYLFVIKDNRTTSNMSQKHFIDNENTSQLIEDALESLTLQNGALRVDKKNKSKYLSA